MGEGKEGGKGKVMVMVMVKEESKLSKTSKGDRTGGSTVPAN